MAAAPGMKVAHMAFAVVMSPLKFISDHLASAHRFLQILAGKTRYKTVWGPTKDLSSQVLVLSDYKSGVWEEKGKCQLGGL